MAQDSSGYNRSFPGIAFETVMIADYRPPGASSRDHRVPHLLEPHQSPGRMRNSNSYERPTSSNPDLFLSMLYHPQFHGVKSG